jgi:hypothetical protein
MTKDEAQSRRGGTDGLFTKPSILFDHSSFTITWTDGQVKTAFSATLGFWNVAYHCEKGYYAEGL